jgi:hypothetical protein
MTARPKLTPATRTARLDKRTAQIAELTAGIMIFIAIMEWDKFDTWMAALFACAAAQFARDISDRNGKSG